MQGILLDPFILKYQHLLMIHHSFIHSYLINSFLVCNMHLTLRDIVVNLITVSEPIVQYSLVEETVVSHVSHII